MDEAKKMKTITFNDVKYEIVDEQARTDIATKASLEDVESAKTEVVGQITQSQTEIDGQIESAKTEIEGKITEVKTDTKTILQELEESRPKRYGYKIKKAESDPDTRVEYIYDAVGMTPAKMNGTEFSYGDWQNVWFVRDNYPCMLNPDGTEAYRLDPNDYNKKWNKDTADGAETTSDVSDVTKTLNAMAAFPTVWVKRWEDDVYEYTSFCEFKYDDGYHAYAHTKADGTIADVVYHACFEGYIDSCTGATEEEPNPASQLEVISKCKYKTDANNKCTLADQCTDVAQAKITNDQCKAKMRSIAGVYPTDWTTTEWERACAQRNGKGWDIRTWSLNCLIADLCTLISKTDNSQAAFGNGNMNGYTNNGTATAHYGFKKTGSLMAKGQFYGSTGDTNNEPMKVFHVENFYADRWERIVGLIQKGGVYHAKMTPEGDGYNLTGVGYSPIAKGLQDCAKSGSGQQKDTHNSELGRVPIGPDFNGSSATYTCDYFWWNNDITSIARAGGSCVNGAGCGSRCLAVNSLASGVGWNLGASLSYVG